MKGGFVADRVAEVERRQRPDDRLLDDDLHVR